MLKKIGLALAIFISSTTVFAAAQAAPSSEDLIAKAHSPVLKVDFNGRKPASTCLVNGSASPWDALKMRDFSSCSPEEVALLRRLVEGFYDQVLPDLDKHKDNALSTSMTVAFMGLAKATLNSLPK